MLNRSMRRSRRDPKIWLGGGRQGSAVFVVVAVLFGISAFAVLSYSAHVLAMQVLDRRNQVVIAAAAAEGVARVMSERVVSAAQQTLGYVDSTVVASLNAGRSTLPLPAGMSLDTVRTRFTLSAIEYGALLPNGAEDVQSTPDAPQTAYRALPRTSGQRASWTIYVTVEARVRTSRGAARSATEILSISKLPPHQAALYANGDLQVCSRTGSEIAISGPVEAEGTVTFGCLGAALLAGDIYGMNGVSAAPSGNKVLAWDGGSTTVGTVSRSDMEANVASTLANWDGRLRVGGALGDELVSGRYADSLVAGTGECLDLLGACGGRGRFSPSVTFQRNTTGTGTQYTLTCGTAYQGQDCNNLKGEITYVPFPFTSAGTAGRAWADPSAPGTFWHGLFPDFRRESRCTAQVNDTTSYRTFRCPSNPYGFVLNMAALTPLPGGVLFFRKASVANALNNASGFQEVVLIRNASSLPHALSIVSEIPVYIEGSYNTVASKASMITAPLIGVLPATTQQQLTGTLVWDSVAWQPTQNLQARTPVEIRAVLRSEYHPGWSYGGLVPHVPLIVGDWSGVTLGVTGAIEGVARPEGTGYAAVYPASGAAPTEMAPVEPAGRRILYDPSLLLATFQPPGTWLQSNTPAVGWGGSRTWARQGGALGGQVVVRRLEMIRRGN